MRLTIDLNLQFIAYKELKSAVESHRARSGSLVMLDARSGDIRHSYADVSKALNVLQFKSEVSVVDGLQNTIDWYRSLNVNQKPK